MIQIVVLLEIKDPTAFRTYETTAIKIMAKYEGKLLAAFKPDLKESSTTATGEIHYLQFPNLEAFHHYRLDPDLANISELRQQAISKTTIYVSSEFIEYGSQGLSPN